MAESAVVAVCALADAAGPERWSSGAIKDAATALEVLAGALSELMATQKPQALDLSADAPGTLRQGLSNCACPAP
ncbi:hypothetical protein [Streptomyces sp. NPDC056544]|uniref:hypothetical protein n=1 Tax=unclassified Streptomyces TaxID=2593676 RepID=UPI00369FACDC